MEKVVEKCLELVQKCWKWRCDMGKVFVGTTHNREYYRHYYILLLMAKALSCSFCRNRKIFTVLSTVRLDAFQPMKTLPDNLLRGKSLTGSRRRNVREADTVSHDLEGTYGLQYSQTS